MAVNEKEIHHGSFVPVPNGIGRVILINALTLIIGGSLGFGTSQMFIVGQVNTSKNDITYLRETDARQDKDLLETEVRLNQRINAISGLMEKNIALNQELVSLVKVQNELLERRK